MNLVQIEEDLKHFEVTYSDFLQNKGITITSSLVRCGYGDFARILWTVQNTDTKSEEFLYQWVWAVGEGCQDFFLRNLMKEQRFIMHCQTFMESHERQGGAKDGELMAAAVLRDRNALFEDLRMFTFTYGHFLKEFNFHINAGMETFTEGNLAVIQWNFKDEILGQSMFALKAGATNERNFFLRSLLKEESFVVSCQHLLKGTEVGNDKRAGEKDQQV